MHPPKADQPGEDAQRLRREVMLDDFDFLLDGLGAQAEERKLLRERAMPHLDVFRHSAALGG